jgi:hypothetical protein
MAINLPPPAIVWNNPNVGQCPLFSENDHGLTAEFITADVKYPDGYNDSNASTCLTDKQYRVYLHWERSLPGGENEGFHRLKFVDSKYPNVLRATP